MARATRASAGNPGILSRLTGESWDAMTAAACASPNHPGSLDRWTRLAREANPALSDEQAERQGERMRAEHFRALARRSHAARQANRATQ